MSPKSLRKWIPAFGFALAFVLLASIALLPGVRYREYEHIDNSRLFFELDSERSDQAYGIMNSGPALTV